MEMCGRVLVVVNVYLVENKCTEKNVDVHFFRVFIVD